MNLQRIFTDQRPPFDLTYLNDFGEAIIRVEEKYCSWPYRNNNINQMIERVFAYELYHQFRLLTNYNTNYAALRLDGEIGKQLENKNLETCGSNSNIIQERFSPDLVIHFGQIDRQEINQKLIIEIKTKRVGNDEIYEAILKLNHYIRILNFQYAVLVSVNTDFDALTLQIRDLFENPNNQVWTERFKRIIVMNYSDRNLTIKTLYKLLNE